MKEAGRTEEVVMRIVLETMEADVVITECHHLMDDLGLDSLDYVDVINAVDKEFAIEANNELSAEIETVEELVKYVNESQIMISK